MAYCAPRGIPHSRFLAWDPDDRDKAVAWMVRQSDTCPGCGTRGDEWDPARGGDRFAYEARIRQCPGCVELERAQDAPEMRQGRGMRVDLVRNPALLPPHRHPDPTRWG